MTLKKRLYRSLILCRSLAKYHQRSEFREKHRERKSTSKRRRKGKAVWIQSHGQIGKGTQEWKINQANSQKNTMSDVKTKRITPKLGKLKKKNRKEIGTKKRRRK